jgi:uncharacterized protein YegP (UPF0339 family)
MLRIKESKDGEFYFVIEGANGEVVATSETYTRRADAERGAEDLRQVMADQEVERQAQNDAPYDPDQAA